MAARLHDDPATRGILLVAMTGYGQPDDRRRTAEAGFEAHIVKPVTSDQLTEVIALCASRMDQART